MKQTIKGVTGKILIVDLSSGNIQVERPSDELYLNYLGGYGLGAYYLFRGQPGGVDPLGPENLLGFFTGLLTGTNGITTNRYMVVGKSPKTGTWGDSNCGGSFGPALKFAGFDAVLFKGQSPKPVYLLVNNGQYELKDATEMWGMDTEVLEDTMTQRHGKVSLSCIGPAGERRSLLSCIITDRGRAAGRSGLGAVMGSKNLKAVVAAGTLPVVEADPERMNTRRKKCLEFMKALPIYEMFHNYGTSAFTAGAIVSGDAPIKNFSGTREDFKNPEKIHEDEVMRYRKKRFACWRCPIGCGAFVELNGKLGHKPEYETIIAFGALSLNNNIESIIQANNICNSYGLDTMSTGVTIAFAVNCYEEGILSKADTDGLELNWGNSKAIVELTEKIARGEGFGKVLENGSKVAAEKIGNGASKLAMHIHGEEIPLHDIRHWPGIGTGYQVDATPGRHTQFGSWFHEDNAVSPGLDYPKYKDKYTYSGKGKAHKIISNHGHAVNCSGMCQFGWTCIRADDVVEFLSAATGVEFSMQDLLDIGERVANLRIAFNIREGIFPGLVKIPDLVLGKPPLERGPTKGVTVDIDTQVSEYFREMNWDEKTGKPSEETLRRLGLDFVIEQI